MYESVEQARGSGVWAHGNALRRLVARPEPLRLTLRRVELSELTLRWAALE